MEYIQEKLTASKVMKQVDNLEHLFWNEEQNSRAILAIQKGITQTDEILADVLESDWTARAHYRNLKYELEKYLNCLQKEHTPDDFLGREHPLEMP